MPPFIKQTDQVEEKADDRDEREKEDPKTTRLKGLVSPPTEQYIIDLASELEAAYKSQDKQIDDGRALRELRAAIELDPGLKLANIEVHDPTATEEGLRVAASIFLNRPVCHVTADGDSDAAIENATKREHWTEESFWSEGSRGGVHTHQMLVDAVVNDGGAWAKHIINKDRWETRYALEPDDFTDDPEDAPKRQTRGQKWDAKSEELKKKAGSPFEWISVDVRTIYPVWKGNSQLLEVLEIQELPLRATFAQYRLGLSKTGEIVPEELGEPDSQKKPWPKTIKRLEHWTKYHVSYVFVNEAAKGGKKSGKIALQWAHGYGRVPYEFAPGIWMNHWRNRKVGWSIYQTKAYLVQFREFLWTILAQLAARDTGSPLFRQRPLGGSTVIGNDGKPRERDPKPWKLAEIIEGAPGETLAPIPFPDISQALVAELETVNKAIEASETPRLPAQLTGLEGAGYAMSTAIAEANIRLGPMIAGLEKLYTQATKFKWDLVERKIGETVWVEQSGERSGYLGLGPEDLSRAVSVRWEINPERASAKLLEARYYHERLEAGTIDWDRAVEKMGDNPDEIRRGKIKDDMRKSEEYTLLMKQSILESAGRGDILARATLMAQTGIVPGATVDVGPPMGATPMGGPGMPGDQAALAGAPNGAGMAPTTMAAQGIGNAPGMPTQPTQASVAAIQQIGG